MQAFILLGAPGTGKGTAAEDLAKAVDLVHLATGDMLRAAIKDGTEVGRKAQSFMESGNLVPDDVIIAIVSERLARGDAGTRYLFDGFPRTLEQAVMLDEMLEENEASVNEVYLLEVPEELVFKRIEGRRICRQCDAVYHIVNMPPAREGVCDQCSGELYQRKDDNRETIRARLNVYEQQTMGLIGYYEERGVLERIPAEEALATCQAILAGMEAAASAS